MNAAPIHGGRRLRVLGTLGVVGLTLAGCAVTSDASDAGADGGGITTGSEAGSPPGPDGGADGQALDGGGAPGVDATAPDATTPDAGTGDATTPGAGLGGTCIGSMHESYVLRTDGVLISESQPSTPHTILDDATGLPLSDIAGVDDGSYHGCASTGAGQVKCWQTDATNGNTFGQLGNGSTTASTTLYRATPVLTAPGVPLDHVTSVTASTPSIWGNYSTSTVCAVKDDKSVWCWGDVTWTLNNGTKLWSGYAQKVTTDGSTALTGAVSAAVGILNACVIMEGSPRAVWCWGQNGDGELGLGDTKARQYPTRVTGLSNPSKVWIAQTGSYYTNSAVCALDGENVRCWGDNSAGAIGTNTQTNPILNPTAVVVQNGSLLAGVTDLEPGHGTFAVLKNDGTIWIWGSGFQGYATNYGVPNVVALGWAGPANVGGPRYVTSDGKYWSAMTQAPVNCNAM